MIDKLTEMILTDNKYEIGDMKCNLLFHDTEKDVTVFINNDYILYFIIGNFKVDNNKIIYNCNMSFDVSLLEISKIVDKTINQDIDEVLIENKNNVLKDYNISTIVAKVQKKFHTMPSYLLKPLIKYMIDNELYTVWSKNKILGK